MTTPTKEILLEMLQYKGTMTAHDIANTLSISSSMTHRHLKKLLEEGRIIKRGTSPKVFYAYNKEFRTKIPVTMQVFQPDPITHKIIEENFAIILPDGTEKYGINAFIDWCMDKKRKFNIEAKAKEYVQMFKDYDFKNKDGLIDAHQKIESTFPVNERYLDNLFFLYPYSLPVFGKTKVANWLFHGKQTQNKLLIKRVLDLVVPIIENYIIKNNYDAISFVPPSVPRTIQFMKELERAMSVQVPIIKIEKVKNTITVPQKTLKDLSERIENVDKTMFVNVSKTYAKVLVVDDFTGSGATLDVIAKKMKRTRQVKQVDGLTITGSLKGFEVVKEI